MRQMEGRGVDVIIPVYRPGERFYSLLRMLAVQTLPVERLILINTEESLWTREAAELLDSLGQEENAIREISLTHIPKAAFDHAATRRLGIAKGSAPVFVCMTDDAVPADEGLLSALASAFYQEAEGEPETEAAYACQLPREDCTPEERFGRQFNYPEQSFQKGLSDLPRLGIKTFFASNVCCAYRRDIYEKLGGFCSHTIFNEDMIYAAKAVKAGYRIAYCAAARVYHSHRYSALEQLHRNFDLGMSQAMHPEVFAGVPSEGEGIRLVKQTAGWLLKNGYGYRIPVLVWQSGFKYLGYRLGKAYRRLPAWLCRSLAMNKTYVEQHLSGKDAGKEQNL